MARIIALGPGGKPQAPERDDRARPVIEWVVSNGQLNRLLLSPRCRTQTDADDVRRALYRSAKYFCSCGHRNCTRKFGNIPSQNKANPQGGCPRGGQRISCQATIVGVTDEKGGQWYAVQFRLFDKRESIREAVRKYGTNPNDWPYWPKRKTLKEK